MFACFTSLAHLGSSAATTLPSISGEPPTPSLPWASSFSRISGSATTSLRALLRRSMITFGVFAGTNIAYQLSTSKSAMDNRLYRTKATGKFNKTASANPVSAFAISPYVVADNVFDYGAGFAFNAATQATTAAAATTLVTSPITAACFACHDNTQSVAHMRGNGGSIYATRSAALGTLETCMVCHDTGRIADIKVMHAK